MQTLVDVSKFTIDEIWLMSYEQFIKEVTHFDLKLYAEAKEAEAHYKELEAKIK